MPPTEPQPVVFEPAPRNRRSVFGNYIPVAAPAVTESLAVTPDAALSVSAPAAGGDLALARSFVHQFLARAFDYPAVETWAWLSATETRSALANALAALEPDPESPARQAQQNLARTFHPGAFDAFHEDYLTAIGHAARGSCPINEIEYGDLKADPLFQPHRLADLAAFYRAFGMVLAPDADERHDHLAIELEFMTVLAAQEASLLNLAPANEPLAVCRDAQRKFLREHLGRWLPAFARRLIRAVGEGPLGALARFTLAFIEAECRRLGVVPGSEDLLLRPADEAASLCDGCGLVQALPGAPAGPAAE